MATEMARWTIVGAVIGLILFMILFGYAALTAPKYTEEQKAEINQDLAVNCSKCLIKENVSCTTDTLQYSQYGAICNLKYISKNCTTCRQV